MDKEEVTMDVLSRKELYVCDVCGNEFHSKKEYDAHCCNVNRAYCMHLSNYNIRDGYVTNLTIIDGYFSMNPPKGRKPSKGMTFFDGMAIEGTNPKEFIGKVFWKKKYEDDMIYDAEKVKIDSKPEDVYVFFTDASWASTAFRKAFDALKPVVIENADNLLKQYNDKFKNYSSIMLNGTPMMFDKINAESDKIKELIDKGQVLNLSIGGDHVGFGTWKSGCKDGEKIYDQFDMSSIDGVSIAEMMSRVCVKEKDKKVKKPKYSKKDLFIMKININWADEIDFECHDVINGEQRMELEKLASKPNTSCHIAFGTNEDGEYDDILGCLSFSSISDDDYKVLKRLGLLQVGDIDYNKIMESFETRED